MTQRTTILIMIQKDFFQEHYHNFKNDLFQIKTSNFLQNFNTVVCVLQDSHNLYFDKLPWQSVAARPSWQPESG